MDFLDLKNISEQGMELVNPTSPEKVLKVGEMAGLQAGWRVIEFGTGYGEVLVLWAQRFDISGVGIDIRPHACQRAEQKMSRLGLGERIEIVCGDAAAYSFEPGRYDVAACVGASFIWGDFHQTVRHMRPVIRPGGRLVIGEPYWRQALAPPDYTRGETAVYTEYELLQMARQEGFHVAGVVRSSHDEWDRYESDNWRGLLAWLEANPDHPERQAVLDHLHDSQDEYFRYAREYLGWALYVLQ